MGNICESAEGIAIIFIIQIEHRRFKKANLLIQQKQIRNILKIV